ncbi:MAG: low temperature requirement protein A [Dermatophilaceae bacterium]
MTPPTHITPAERSASTVAHGIRQMTGRDPEEKGRAATPLELLFDLTFVVAFANAGNEMAHLVAAGHTWAGVAGFCFAIFGITWAWINFSWFASAYDTDDWAYRLTTMVQMIGVVVFALGMPALFASIEHGEHVDNQILVLGYLIMRVAMLTQWLRAARQCPQRTTCLTYAASIALAQLGWVALAWATTSLVVFAVCSAVLVGIEFAGPYLAEKKEGGTPWNTHHIAERYSLLAIIALGEGVVGSVVSLGAAVSAEGWTMESALVALASMGLTFAMWWNYFGIDFAGILHARRDRSFAFGYGHIPLFGAIAALGAGLHIVAYYLEAHHDPEEYSWVTIGETGAVLAVAIPVLVFVITLFSLWAFLFRSPDKVHPITVTATCLVILASVWMAAAHVPISVALIVLCFAPALVVVAYELYGHRHQARALAEQSTGH